MGEGLRKHQFARNGDLVEMVASSPAGRTTTNMFKIHRVGTPVHLSHWCAPATGRTLGVREVYPTWWVHLRRSKA